MEKYNKDIINQNRHMFIYDDGIDRRVFLKQLENDYPVKLDEYSPMAIYMDDLELPEVEEGKIVDKIKINILVREYLIYSIAYKIMKNICEQIDINLLSDRINNVLFWLDKRNDSSNAQVDDLKKLLQDLETSVNFYVESYINFLKTDKINLDMDKLPISYIEIQRFARDIKKFLNNNAYFGIIIDQQGNLSKELQQAVNWLITKRINGNISVKVFTKEEDWKTYCDLDGIFAENVHDYESIKINRFTNQ